MHYINNCEVLGSIWSVEKLYQIKTCGIHAWQIRKNSVLNILLDLYHKITLSHFHSTKSCVTSVSEASFFYQSAHVWLSEVQYVSTPFPSLSCTDMHNSHQCQRFLIGDSTDQKLKSRRGRANGVLRWNIKICPFNFVYEALVDT